MDELKRVKVENRLWWLVVTAAIFSVLLMSWEEEDNEGGELEMCLGRSVF